MSVEHILKTYSRSEMEMKNETLPLVPANL